MSIVRVTWVDSITPGVTGHKIYRDDVEIADVGMAIQTFDDATAEPDTTYKYEVQAYTATHESIIETIGVNVDNITTEAGAVLTDNLLAYYRFNDDAVDQISAHNGVLNGATFEAGKMGNAMKTTQVASAGAVVPSSPDFTFGNGVSDVPFSISLYIRFDSMSASQNGWIFARRPETAANREYAFALYQGVLYFNLYSQLDQAASLDLTYSVDGVLSPGTWYHMIFTYDGSGLTTGLNLYIDNGANVGSVTEGGTYVAMDQSTADVTIGHVGYSSSIGFSLNGALDGLGVWNKELDAAERTEIYDIQNAGNELI